MTRIMTVAQDSKVLEEMATVIGKAYSGSVVYAFADPMLAVQHAYNNPVDVIFSEVDMRRLSGFDLLRLIRKRSPNMPIHLISDSDRYECDALRASADSYMVRPLNIDKIRELAVLDGESEW